jgi:hypothetical protein
MQPNLIKLLFFFFRCVQVHDVLRTALRRHTETLLAVRHSAQAALKENSDKPKAGSRENAAAAEEEEDAHDDAAD